MANKNVPVRGGDVQQRFHDNGDGSYSMDVYTGGASSGTLPAALGGTTAANSLPVVLSSDGPFAVATGSVTETAPTTDTASSGLNGRMQRIAQRLTSLIGLLPAALGPNGGLKVDIVSTGVSQYQEDGASVSGDFINVMGAVRNDSDATNTNADADYTVPVADLTGRLRVIPEARHVKVSVTPTLGTAGSASGNSLHTADMTFAGCARINGGSGVIVGLTIQDKSIQGTPGELWLFDQSVASTLSATTHTTQTAWNLNDTDLPAVVGKIDWGTVAASTNNEVYNNWNVRLPFKCSGSSTSLLGVLVTRGAPTYAASDLTVILHIIQD